MKRIFEFSLIFIVILVLAGCSFPGKRMYVVENCAADPTKPYLCTFMPNGSEFAFVKQIRGAKYEIWVNQQPDVADGPMRILKNCEAPVERNKFECDLCGAPASFVIVKASSSDCELPECVKIKLVDTVACPGGGQGTGGSNEN